MNILKFWWKTSVRKQVVYGEDGRPLDCKGLRYRGKKPFGEGTEYYITSEYFDWDYMGRGSYCKPRVFISDRKNPYWMDGFLRATRKYKDFKC